MASARSKVDDNVPVTHMLDDAIMMNIPVRTVSEPWTKLNSLFMRNNVAVTTVIRMILVIHPHSGDNPHSFGDGRHIPMFPASVLGVSAKKAVANMTNDITIATSIPSLPITCR